MNIEIRFYAMYYKKMISKANIKRVKNFLIKVKLWELFKIMTNRDKGLPLNPNLLTEGTNFYSQFITENDLVFDVGANFGNRVEIFVKLGAKVIAIEPQRKCAEYLRRKFKNRIYVENVGLGSSNEIKQLYVADSSVLSSFSTSYIAKVKDTRHKTSIWVKSEPVQIVTLDELIHKHGEPIFIKIDVEGFELEVIGGLSKKSGIISFEYTVPEFKEDVFKCIQKLHHIGYTAFTYSRGESMVLASNWKSFEEFIEVVTNETFHDTRFGDIYAKV